MAGKLGIAGPARARCGMVKQHGTELLQLYAVIFAFAHLLALENA